MKQVTTFHRRSLYRGGSKRYTINHKTRLWYYFLLLFYIAVANITPRIHIFFDEYDYCCVHRYKN